jgi:predicted enzyme related to lactoylglutathione lyase
MPCSNRPPCIPISRPDLQRARQFYEEKIGLKPVDIREGGVIYEFGNHTACFMYPTPNAGTSQASQAFWEVKDVEREVADLRKRGVKFEDYDMPNMKTVNGIAAVGQVKTAWFKDTEGNIMALVERLDRPH